MTMVLTWVLTGLDWNMHVQRTRTKQLRAPLTTTLMSHVRLFVDWIRMYYGYTMLHKRSYI